MNFEDFSLNYHLSELNLKVVKSYAKLFFAEKDERLLNFIDNVASDCNINPSELNFSEESLEVLDRWLVNHVECVKLTKEEYEVVRKSLPDYIDINDWRFSDVTYSNIINVGLYLGEVMIHKHPNLKWEQCLNGKKNIDYGQMIIRVGKIGMNPMRLVDVTCLKIVDNSKSPKRLREIVHLWEEYL